MEGLRISVVASEASEAREAESLIRSRHSCLPPDESDVIVALGGDGFMLSTLRQTQGLDKPVYGMNRGTVGFLMNDYDPEGLDRRIFRAKEEVIHPLRMVATSMDGEKTEDLAINEVSVLRSGPQAAGLKISVDGKTRMEELVCDGAMVSTPAGSTAYNYSAHGPILPVGSSVLALTAVAAFRPRRWRGALLPESARVEFEVLDPGKRPVMAEADGRLTRGVSRVEIESDSRVSYRILFDPGHGLEERLIREQFS